MLRRRNSASEAFKSTFLRLGGGKVSCYQKMPSVEHVWNLRGTTVAISK
jgi:hypothetical protein